MKKIIFACVHNAGRSRMAAAFFNALADPDRAHAVSAGTKPAEHVNPQVVEAMRELGYDLKDARPKRLTEELASGAELLITMGCGDECPYVPGLRRDDWAFSDPAGQPLPRVRAIRDEIASRVRALVAAEGLQRRHAPAKPHVLFVCTHNAARSQMGEALLRRYADDRFEISSAGFHPTAVHPLTHRALSEVGIASAALRAKPATEFLGKARLKYAIIVCGDEEPNCPRIFPFTLHTLHWPFDDPTKAEGAPEAQLQEFRRVRDEMDAQIRTWLRDLDSEP